MSNVPWLTIAILLPLVGAGATVLAGRGSPARGRQTGFVFAAITFGVVAGITISYLHHANSFSEQIVWIKAFGAHYALGLNGIGLALVALTATLVPVVMLASWRSARGGRWGEHGFFAWALVLEALSLGVFTATDVFLFYVLFEATLIPMYFLIGGYGGPRRQYAAVKFLLYSLLGGLLMLASVIGLFVVSSQHGTPSYLLSDLQQIPMSKTTGRWLFLGFMIAFAVKAPMVPFHTWLPDVAESSNPGASVLLVGVLDKIGTFGMIRFCLGLFPEASRWATPVVLALALLSVLYGAILAIGQTDILRLISYTSISHFGFMVMGIFAMTSQGMVGSTLYMFNHGLSTAALFLIAGFLVHRHRSQRISDFGGIEKAVPVLAGTFLFAGLSSLSMPGLSPFVSEFMVLAGTFSRYRVVAIIGVTAIVLAALYILIMYQRVFTGPARSVESGGGVAAVSAGAPSMPAGTAALRTAGGRLRDMTRREKLVIAPLVALILVLGVYPKPATTVIGPAVAQIMQHVGVSDPAPHVTASGEGN